MAPSTKNLITEDKKRSVKKLFQYHFFIIFLINSSQNWVIDPSQSFYYYWSSIVSLAVLYNFIILIGRSAFLLLQERLLIIWLICDYLCDICYIIDTFIQTRKGLFI
jgi:hypothetical protein